MRQAASLTLGAIFIALGVGVSTTKSEANTFLDPTYHPRVLGYTVPRSLRGTWYMGTYKYHATKHRFSGAHYYKGKSAKIMITKHLVEMRWELMGSHQKVWGYYDGSLDKIQSKWMWQVGEQYIPVTYSYRGHNYRGLDVNGHNPDELLTRNPTSSSIGLRADHYDGIKKVKLVKVGW